MFAHIYKAQDDHHSQKLDFARKNYEYKMQLIKRKTLGEREAIWTRHHDAKAQLRESMINKVNEDISRLKYEYSRSKLSKLSYEDLEDEEDLHDSPSNGIPPEHPEYKSAKGFVKTMEHISKNMGELPVLTSLCDYQVDEDLEILNAYNPKRQMQLYMQQQPVYEPVYLPVSQNAYTQPVFEDHDEAHLSLIELSQGTRDNPVQSHYPQHCFPPQLEQPNAHSYNSPAIANLLSPEISRKEPDNEQSASNTQQPPQKRSLDIKNEDQTFAKRQWHSNGTNDKMNTVSEMQSQPQSSLPVYQNRSVHENEKMAMKNSATSGNDPRHSGNSSALPPFESQQHLQQFNFYSMHPPNLSLSQKAQQQQQQHSNLPFRHSQHQPLSRQEFEQQRQHEDEMMRRQEFENQRIYQNNPNSHLGSSYHARQYPQYAMPGPLNHQMPSTPPPLPQPPSHACSISDLNNPRMLPPPHAQSPLNQNSAYTQPGQPGPHQNLFIPPPPLQQQRYLPSLQPPPHQQHYMPNLHHGQSQAQHRYQHSNQGYQY